MARHCCWCSFSICGEQGCSVQDAHCCGFSCWGALALGSQASVVAARGLSSCDAWALFLWVTCALPRPGVEPVLPPLAVKVKVAQSCPTLCDPMDCTVRGILQARILEWIAFPSPGDLPNPGIEHRSPTLQADSFYWQGIINYWTTIEAHDSLLLRHNFCIIIKNRPSQGPSIVRICPWDNSNF